MSASLSSSGRASGSIWPVVVFYTALLLITTVCVAALARFTALRTAQVRHAAASV
ncbi:hypothetical protein AB0I53_45755 [Saccharopolyspora sp. NPDC050389]|uniref:hypothetical protein n=1 Tax=Saccharopolyspora sp. NPDC050389 TaxID=3155516 RepID=UPI0033DC71A7